MTPAPTAMSSIRLALALVAFIPLLPVAAQERPDTTRLNPVLVTATRVTAPGGAAVNGSSVLLGEELRRRGLTTVADALRELPGVAVARSGSPGSTTSLFMRGGESDFAKVLVDGMPVNEPGGRFDFGALSLENVDRIEVVRGPASVLYG